MNQVSILVPIYNVEKYIKRCLISLFEQDFSLIEYVFVNDASTDNSMSILRQTIAQYPERSKHVKIIEHRHNRGLAVARRTAIENSTSPYILHIDSDDYIDKDMVTLMYDKVCMNNADLVLSDTIVEYAHCTNKIGASWNGDKWKYLSLMLIRKIPANIWGKLIKREIIVNNSIFAQEGVNQGEDYQVIPQIVYYAKKICYAKSIYYYNKENQLSYTNNVTYLGLMNIIQSQEVLNAFFVDKKEISNDIMEESCIYNKLTLLSIASYENYPVIVSLYNNINCNKFKFKFTHKIILILLTYKKYRLVYCLISIFQLFFRRK